MNPKQPSFLALQALILAVCLVPVAAQAQAVWNNADDRDYDGNGTFLGAYWSYGFEPANPATGFQGHVGNWSGNPYPGTGGVTGAYLGAPGNTLCDVQVALSTLTIAPASQLTMLGSSSLSVASTDVQGDGTLINGMTGGGFPIFNNTGTFRKSAGTGTYTIDPTIVFNSLPGSVIQVDSGTLQLPGIVGLLDTVTFNTAAGTVVDLVGDRGQYGFNFVQGTLSSGTGVGTVRMRANQLDYDYRKDGASCTFNFPGDVFQWTGGIIGGTGSGEVPLFYNTGVMNLSGDGTKFSEAYITNENLMIQTGAGNLDIGGYVILTNAAGAIYDLRTDAGIVTTGYGKFTNLGLFKKSAGTGTSTLTAAFNNQGGTIEVDSGTLQLSNVVNSDNGTNTGGVFNVAANSVLDLGTGARFTGMYTGSGAGVVRFSSGTLRGNYNLDVSSTVLNFPPGLFQWTGGTMGDYPTELFANNGTITLAGDGDKQFDNTFTNNGVINHTGTGALSRPALFTNAAGALYDIQADVSIGDNGVNYPVPFTNAGMLQKSGGTGVSSVGENFANPGTVSVQTGTLDFQGNIAQIVSGALGQGTWTVANGATLTFSNYPDGITINQATISLIGPNAQFPAINPLVDNHGTFSLLAQKQFTTAGAFSNEGTLNLDAGSTLHVAGAYTGSGAASTLAITLGGTATQGASSPGILQVNGAATVAGNLAVIFAEGAALPGAGDTLTILSATAPITGSFGGTPSGTRLNTTGGRGSFLVTYGAGTASPNAVTLSQFLLPGQSALPVVSLTTSVKTALANDGVDGTFLLTLSTATGADVVVNFEIKGTAVNGTDYTLLKASKKIKAGKTSKPIQIIPVDASYFPGGKKAVKLTLLPGTGYTLGGTTTAKVVILYDR